MISIDIAKLVPHKALALLVALVPGVFFWLSVLFANPEFGNMLVTPARRAFSLNPYALFFSFLFVAYITGVGFILLVSLIQWVLRLAYRFLVVPVRHIVRKHVALPLVRRITRIRPGSPITFRKRLLLDLVGGYPQNLQNIVNEADARIPPDEFQWWEVIAKRLLAERFGVTTEQFPPAPVDLNPLVTAFSTPTKVDVRGSLQMISSQATGWAGLAARRFAPALHTRWYTVFAGFLIATGLIHDFYVAKRLADPEVAGGLFLRDLLKQFPNLKPAARTRPK